MPRWQTDDREPAPETGRDLPLWGAPLPYAKGSDTSRDAAEQQYLVAALQRRRVLQAFRAAGQRGLTPDEAATLLGISVLACRPRCVELHQSGFLEKTDEKRTNVSGLKARVLRAVRR